MMLGETPIKSTKIGVVMLPTTPLAKPSTGYPML